MIGKKYYVLLLVFALVLVESVNTLTGLSIFESGSSSVEPDHYFENLQMRLDSDFSNLKSNLIELKGVLEYMSYYWLFILVTAGLWIAKGRI